MNDEILKQIRSPLGGFKNPLNDLSTVLLKLTPIDANTLYGISQSQAMTQGINGATLSEIQAAADSITLAYNSVNNMLGHSNRISGVNLTGDTNLAVIAKTMSAARNSDGTKSCDAVLAAFGSIRKAAELLSDATRLITDYERFLADINRYIGTIPAQLAAYANKLEAQILNDVQALAIAQIKIMEQSVANTLTELFEDECSGQIMTAVLSNNLKTAVVKTIADKKRKILK